MKTWPKIFIFIGSFVWIFTLLWFYAHFLQQAPPVKKEIKIVSSQNLESILDKTEIAPWLEIPVNTDWEITITNNVITDFKPK